VFARGLDVVWPQVEAAREGHGAIIVIADDQDLAAQLESLSVGFFAVPPAPFSQDFTALCGVDGAVFLSTSGRVHAFGVILDGRDAPGIGDPARGARYNSARRYIASQPKPTIVVVVSEDGMVNVELPRRQDA
jgi:DNA integrity scanning protein DisA with diadenylate cyclase activity